MIDEKKLKTVTNYAQNKKKSRGWIYQLIHRGVITPVVIDGITFIKTDKE